MLMNQYESFLQEKQKDTFLRFSDEVNNYRLELMRLTNILDESQSQVAPIKQSLNKLKSQRMEENIIKAMVDSLEEDFMGWLKYIAKLAADYKGTIIRLSDTVDMIVDDTNRVKIKDMDKGKEWEANSESLWARGHAISQAAMDKLKTMKEELVLIEEVLKK